MICLSLPIAVQMNHPYTSPLPDGQQPQVLFRVEHSGNSSFRNHNMMSRSFGITTYPGIEIQTPRSSLSSIAGVMLSSGIDI
jgi:hypothetical protein